MCVTRLPNRASLVSLPFSFLVLRGTPRWCLRLPFTDNRIKCSCPRVKLTVQERRALGVPTAPLLRAFESREGVVFGAGDAEIKKKKKKRPVPAPKDLQGLQVLEVSKGIRQHDEGPCGADTGLHTPAKVGMLRW